MRRENSTFKAGFISEEGNALKNHDYFAYVELDQYACYVVASGISNFIDSEGARLAVEYIITKFQEEPSISKRAVKRYLDYANNKLRRHNSYEREKASVTVVVTDYAKMRYGHAGNTRFRLYHNGKVKNFSSDMSLSQDLADRERIPRDLVARHQQRNNLYAFLGQVNFQPFISKAIKLASGDVIALYTRGIWENLATGELDDVIGDATDDPQATIDSIEEMILSKQPEELQSYTAAVIFVDQIFEDPGRRKKSKRIILISVVVLLLLTAIIVISVILHNQKDKNIQNMNTAYEKTVEYMVDHNFIRAKDECEKTLELAEKVNDKEMIERLNEYLLVIDAIIQGDEYCEKEAYEDAKSSYQNAEKRMRYADNIGQEYVQEKLDLIERYLVFEDSMELGDTLLAKGDYDAAEKEYSNAKDIAIGLHDTTRKQLALEALTKLYEGKQMQQEEAAAEAAQKSDIEVGAAEFTAKGDEATAQGDYQAAVLYYAQALEKYQELGDATNADLTEKKLNAAQGKATDIDAQMAQAQAHEEQGSAYQGQQNFYSAKAEYLLAKNIYAKLGNDEKVAEVQGIIDILDHAIEQ